MAIRAVDRVVTLTPPPREGAPDLDSLHYLPFSAAVGPMAVQKDPSPPGNDAWEKRRRDYYVAMQGTHGVSLSYDKKSGKLRVPKSMDQMLAAAPLLPAIMSLAPGLLKSQVRHWAPVLITSPARCRTGLELWCSAECVCRHLQRTEASRYVCMYVWKDPWIAATGAIHDPLFPIILAIQRPESLSPFRAVNVDPSSAIMLISLFRHQPFVPIH